MKTSSVRPSLCIILLLSLFLLLSGCDKTSEDNVPSDAEIDIEQENTPDLPGGEPSSPTTEPDPTTDSDPISDQTPEGPVNPLTGLCDGISETALSNRPLAIMVSNIITSLPQWGVSDADIIIEMLAEGRITRFMAIYQNPAKIDHIASIRSARPYFIDMAQSFGAIYIHFGGSVPAYEAIAERDDLIDLDGIQGSWEGSVFFRDPDRKAKLGSEHSVYSTGELLQQGLAKLNCDLTQNGHPSAFTFHEHHSAEQGEPCRKVQITFSERHKPYFEYDPDTGTYLRYQYDAKQMDAWTNEQISAKNVLILRMDTTDVPNSALHLIEIQTTGSGEGYYLCDGKYIPITWEKSDYNGELKFFDKDHHELVFACGQTFISCCLRTATVNIE